MASRHFHQNAEGRNTRALSEKGWTSIYIATRESYIKNEGNMDREEMPAGEESVDQCAYWETHYRYKQGPQAE